MYVFSANLDVQYIMGVASGVPTTFWYDPSQDFLATWITTVAASTSPPLVISISYGATESAMPKSMMDAFDIEAIKLGVMGTSIMVSSGDDGAVGTAVRKSVSSCGYAPDWPASSPYVTSVGATQGPEFGTPEIACSSKTQGTISSGGGFSNYYARPSWQTAAVTGYLSTNSPVAGYATTGRGYPDVSLMGNSYYVTIGGKPNYECGTSASSPAFAGL
jgi:tripeptidyl-peptidase-1